MVITRLAMRKSLRARMRQRIQARLDELGMTGRELAQHVGHGDAWISGVLKGAQGVAADDLDAIAEKLGWTPSELVRHDEDTLREVTPSEMRILRHYQVWPQTVQDRWLAILDYFAAQVPDRDTAVLLDRIRTTPRGFRRPVLDWINRLLEEGNLPADVFDGRARQTGDGAAEPSTTPRVRFRKRILDSRTSYADPHDEETPSQPPPSRSPKKRTAKVKDLR